MTKPSKKRRGAKSRKKGAAKVKQAPAAELSYGGTESDAIPAIPECADMLPEPVASDIVEEMPAVMVDAVLDETVRPSAPNQAAAPTAGGVRRWLGKIFARIYGIR